MTIAQDWPIAANLGQLSPRTRSGGLVVDAPLEDWSRTLGSLARLGIQQIDPTDVWLPLVELSAPRRAQFTTALSDEGLTVPAISLTRHSVVHPRCGDDNLATVHRYLDIAPEVGASVVNIGFMEALTPQQQSAMWFWLADGHHDDPDLRPRAIERVRDLAEHAARTGVRLSLEMYENTFLGTADDAVAFVRDVDHASVGLNPDLGNLVRLHQEIGDVNEMFEKVLPVTNFWHIKNYSRDFDPATGSYSTAPTPLKYGFINYRHVIGRALELGFDGPFCCEHYGADSIGVIGENIEYVRGVLDYWS